MSSSDRTILRAMAQPDLTQIPTTPMERIRWTGQDNFAPNDRVQQSAEIDGERNIQDLIRVGIDATGGYGFELSYGSHDAALGGLLANDWAGAVDDGSDFTFVQTASASAVTDDLASGAFADVVVGQWLRIAGGALDALNAGTFRVTAKADSDNITVLNPDGVTDASGKAGTVKGQHIQNGGLLKPFIFEKEHLDRAKFFAFTGQVYSGLTLTWALEQIVGGSFTLAGLAGLPSAGSTIGTGAPIDAPATRVLDAVSNIDAVWIGDAISTERASQIELSVNGNVEPTGELGVEGATEINLRTFDSKATIRGYFKQGDLYDDALGQTERALAIVMSDPAGNQLVFDLPRVRFSQPKNLVAAKNGDVFMEVQAQGLKQSTYGFALGITKIAA